MKATRCLCVVRDDEHSPFKVLSPCGVCQERLRYWGAEVKVGVTTPDGALPVSYTHLSGVAMMVETLTDNRNRTAANLRHYFDKVGGNLGNTGCVGFLFSQQGVIVLDVEGKDEETVMELSLIHIYRHARRRAAQL